MRGTRTFLALALLFAAIVSCPTLHAVHTRKVLQCRCLYAGDMAIGCDCVLDGAR